MCGIAGIFAYAAAERADRAELRAIRDHMQRRGPDGAGEWFSPDGRLGLAHRRLSIIDLSERAAQPMLSADGLRVVSFNGEIYNYRALRDELLGMGRTLRTESDTEVLLELYAVEGEAMVHRLRGMFAFALFDAQRGQLLLARDPYGIKPLYYSDDGSTLRLASQVKALLAGGRVSRALDPAGRVGFYLLGSVPEPHTIRRDVKALPAGSTLLVDAHGPRAARRYFSVAASLHAAAAGAELHQPAAVVLRVREALADSVRHHMVADVKVGAFLSAGIDSGSLLGLMAEHGSDAIEAVTLGFSEFAGLPEDEVPLAKTVARHYGAHHSVRTVDAAEFEADLPALLDAMDQPTVDGINSWFISKAAHEHGLKVAVSGLGGDELFGGYPAFRDVPRWVRLMRWPQRVPALGRSLRALALPALQRSRVSPKLAGLAEYGGTYAGAYLLRRGLFMPWELDQLLDRATLEEGLARLRPLEHIEAQLQPDPGAPFTRVAALEAALYMRNQLLRDADWASMAHSLEVRVPLVDAWLLRSLAPVQRDPTFAAGKRLIAASPSRPLPSALLERRKTGFTTPIARWIESSAQLQTFRELPSLARPGCHWSRRFAYAVGRQLA